MLICNRCGKEFNENDNHGALLFGHPVVVINVGKVKKYHICQDCEKIILAEFRFGK